MRTVPSIGRLDLTLAALLVVERHDTLVGREPTEDEVIDDVLSVAEHLDIPAEQLGDVASFEDGVRESMSRLVDAGWLSLRVQDGIARLRPQEIAESALAWIRARLASDAAVARALDHLELALAERVLTEYEESAPTPQR